MKGSGCETPSSVPEKSGTKPDVAELEPITVHASGAVLLSIMNETLVKFAAMAMRINELPLISSPEAHWANRG
jgi:hypothetical protein